MSMRSQQVILDENVLSKAEIVFSKYGLSVEQAINIFIDRTISLNRFPFRNIPQDIPNKMLMDDEYNIMDLIFDYFNEEIAEIE